MPRRLWLVVLALTAFPITSCQQAQQYPRAAKEVTPTKDADKPAYWLAFMAPRTRHDLPIVFVSQTSEEWERLPKFWNALPFPAGMPTVHIGHSPLGALIAMAATEQSAAIKIKVPPGLPDPTPHIPATNPPSLGRWRLGQKLFFEAKLKAGADTYSCASCHNPDRGFADASARPHGGAVNALSLVNVVYNRRQFWDGRVLTLEETLVRGLDDERSLDADQALKLHIWGGFVRTLVEEGRYNYHFDLVFGVDHPTQDTVAKALATYMRTILSGNSLFDRAAEPKGAEQFKAVLDDAATRSLRDQYTKDWTSDQMPALLAKGYELFRGKARCAACHTGPLFTDHDYHNIGYPGDEGAPPPGKETGRALQTPIGFKEARLIGAFRTPTLRNLPKSRPYFHNGALPSLPQVVDFYDHGVQFSLYLAKALKDGEREQRLELSDEERDALVMFLRALDGTPVDAMVASPK